MTTKFKNISLGGWNVRGLNDDRKCEVVRDYLSSNSFDILFLQETKLHDTTSYKRSIFLPANLDEFEHVDAIGTAGGILTAWNSKNWKISAKIAKKRTLTVHFLSVTSDFQFWATNVYGPTADAERD